MKTAIRYASLTLSLISTLVITLTVIFLATSLVKPGIYGIDASDWFPMLAISGMLIASTAIPFTLTSLSTNLMIAAYSEERKVHGLRLLLILVFVPFLLWVLMVPFLALYFLTYGYGLLSSWICSFIPGVRPETVGGWVFLALMGEALFYAFRYNLYGWLLSTKKGTSLNLAESQYEVVYEKVQGGVERAILDFVKAGIRLSAFNLVLVLLWSFIMISGVTTMPIGIGTLPSIIAGLILGSIPPGLLELYLGKRRKGHERSG